MLWFIEFGRGTALPQTPEGPPQHGDLADAAGKLPPGARHYRWNCCSCELLSPCCERTHGGARRPQASPAVDRSPAELAAVPNLPSFSGEVVAPRRRPPPSSLYAHPPLQRSPAPRRDWRLMAEPPPAPEIAVLENAARSLPPAGNQSSDVVVTREVRQCAASRSLDAVDDVSALVDDATENQMCLPCSKSFESFPRLKNQYSPSKEVVVTQQLNSSSGDLVNYKISTISTSVLSQDKQLLKGISFLPLLNTCIGKSEHAENQYDEIELDLRTFNELGRGKLTQRTAEPCNKDIAIIDEVSDSNIVLGRISPTVVTDALKKRSESQKSPSGKRTKSLNRAKTFHRSRTAYGKITGSLRKSRTPHVECSESEAEQETSLDGRRVGRNSLPLDALGRLLPAAPAPDEQVHQKVFATSSGSTCSDFVTADSYSPCAEHTTSSRRSTSSDLFATGSDVTASEMDTIFNDLHSYTDDDIANEMISSEHFLSNTVSFDDNEFDCSKAITDDEFDLSGIDNSMTTGMEDPNFSFCLSLTDGSYTQEFGDSETPKALASSSEALSEGQAADDNASSTGDSTITPRHVSSCSDGKRRPFGHDLAAAFLDRSFEGVVGSSNESDLVAADRTSRTGDVPCSPGALRTTDGSDAIIAGRSLKTITKKASSDSGINVGDKHFADDDTNGSEAAAPSASEAAAPLQNNSCVGASGDAVKRGVSVDAARGDDISGHVGPQSEAGADAGGRLGGVDCAGDVPGSSENKCSLL